MSKNLLRMFAILIMTASLAAGAVGIANAQDASVGTVGIGGNTNNNGTGQGNTQSQDQVGGQGQTVGQDNTNNATQNNSETASAGGSVSNTCSASQVEDDLSDDSATCTSGDSSAGDSSVGDSNQANAGDQSGANGNSQNFDQNGGNQANAPRNTSTQDGNIDVSDIGGDITSDDDGVDNDGTLNNSDNSDNNSGVQGNDNQVGGAGAISALIVRLAEIIASILGTPVVTIEEICSDLLAVSDVDDDPADQQAVVDRAIAAGLVDPGTTVSELAIDVCRFGQGGG